MKRHLECPRPIYAYLPYTITYKGESKRTSAYLLQHIIYKELERVLYKEKSPISLVKAAELTHTMYQLNIMLPESNHPKKVLLKMDEDQSRLKNIIDKYY